MLSVCCLSGEPRRLAVLLRLLRPVEEPPVLRVARAEIDARWADPPLADSA
jgi:hypothetical protein